jgi:hypothetical protein
LINQFFWILRLWLQGFGWDGGLFALAHIDNLSDGYVTS